MGKIFNTAKGIRRRIAETRENGDVVQTVVIIALYAVIVFVVGGMVLQAIINRGNTPTNQSTASKSSTPSPVASAPASAPAASAAPIDIPIGSVLSIIAIVVAVIGVIMWSIWFFRKMSIFASKTSANTDAWNTLVAKHRELRAAWAAYELDAVKLLDFPLMTDMREPATIAMHKALKHAQSVEPKDIHAVRFIDASTSPFASAVNELDVAFHTAEAEARRVSWSKFSPEERKRLATAKNLLHIAVDTAASESERQMAYKRVFKELEGLIHIPEKAILALEETHMLSIAA